MAIILAVEAIPTAAASQQTNKRKFVEFDHEECASSRDTCRAAYVLELRDDEQFEIRITKTDKANLVFDIAGFLAARPSQNAPQAAAELGDTTFVQTHDKRYGGYLVNIRPKPNATSELPDATLMIT
ncbi:MAG: hypothetical protein J0626_06480, partial [Rhodospirillaceae bacterium]|nr:hypothetical protein [Rhodospirillaceae bacterium]